MWMWMWMAVALGGTSWQAQVDLFDLASPGAGVWPNRVVVRDDGHLAWQAFVAVGGFMAYRENELEERGFGRATERRPFLRLGAHAFVWRGAFVGAHHEQMARWVRHPTTGEQAWAYMPTVQPAVGWLVDPGEVGRGFTCMPWLAPRLPVLRREVVIDDKVWARPSAVEFASGLNVGWAW